MKRHVTIDDFKLEFPGSLREMVEEELFSNNIDNAMRGRKVQPISDDTVDQLMQRVYTKIEREALATYSSNECWALKQWALEHILKDEVWDETADNIAHGLISPVLEWQTDSFDPLLNLKRTLQYSGKKTGYVKECLKPASWFVSQHGRKNRYAQDEIMEFLEWLDKRYEKRDREGLVVTHGRETSTYVTRVHQFKRFLESLPEDEATGRKQIIPFQLPSFPDKFNQPSFSKEEIESIIYAAIMYEKPAVVLRIALATIYGCRCGEIASMTSEHININGGQPTVDIPTEKKGKRVPQPIPDFLVPLFSVQLNKSSTVNITRQLRRVCRKAQVPCAVGTGMHAIRRSVVTTLYSDTDLKEISIRRFMRWSEGRQQGVMPRYVKTPVETTDIEVLTKHPFVKMWEELFPFTQYLPQYSSLIQFMKNRTQL